MFERSMTQVSQISVGRGKAGQRRDRVPVIPRLNYKLFLAALDVLAVVSSLMLAAYVRYDLNPGWFDPWPAPWPALWQVVPYAAVIWVLSLRMSGMYRPHLRPLDEGFGVLKAAGVTFLLLFGIAFFYRGLQHSYSRATVILMAPILVGLTLILRMLGRFVWHQVLRLESGQGEALVVGMGPIARHLAEACQGRHCDFRVSGFLQTPRDQEGSVEAREGAPALPVVGRLDEVDAVLRTGGYRALIVTDGALSHDEHLELAEACLRHGCEYLVVPDIFELMLDRVQVNMIGGMPLLGLKSNTISGVNGIVKRVFDLVVVSILLVLTSPLFLLCAVAIKLSSPGPIFFRQERVGLNGRTFQLLKFRSMHVADDAHVREYARKWIEEKAPCTETEDGQKVYKVADDPRIFPFGAFIRKYSIDELPQFINVLRGEMSLIGPRPPTPYEVEVYRDWHRRRFETLPGITGLWQVSGRHRLDFDQMVKLDIEYIENWSLGLDLKIAAKTVREVLSGGGA